MRCVLTVAVFICHRCVVRCDRVHDLPLGLLLPGRRVGVHDLPGGAALGLRLRVVPPMPQRQVRAVRHQHVPFVSRGNVPLLHGGEINRRLR